MNKRGLIAIYALMLGLCIIILALALAPSGRDFVDSAMNVSSDNSIGLDCSNSSISDYDSAGCIAVDFTLPFFFGGILLLGGLVLTAKIIF